MIKELLNKQDIERILSRIAHEIVEHNKGTAGICLVGIQRGGVHLARRLAARIAKLLRRSKGVEGGNLCDAPANR